MKSFLEYINESTLSSSSLNKARYLIQSYLTKKVGQTFSAAGLEQFKSSKGSGYGLRFYFPKTLYSVRFNWQTLSGDENRLKSIDFWMKQSSPTFHIAFDDDTSLVQILPFVARILLGKEKVKLGKFVTAPMGTSLNESSDDTLDILLEEYNMSNTYPDIIKIIVNGGTKSQIWKKYKSAGGKIAEYIQKTYPHLFVSQGKSLVWNGGIFDEEELLSKQNEILNNLNSASGSISKGASEEYIPSPELVELEDNKERIAFETQIEHLTDLTKLVVSGASNALFVAGRGGIGKTYNVEKTLADLGYSDGKQYFKNTGSSSAAGLYRLFARYHDKILFFDDSDSTLDSQEARNLMKAATDTKAIRKIVWSKAGGNVVEPDEYESMDELLDAGMIPRYFNYTGKVIFISNLDPNKLDPDGALRTRAFLIDISPTEDEIYDFISKLADNFKVADGLQLSSEDRQKVVEILRKGKSKQTANFRKAERGFNMMAGANDVGVKSDISDLISLYA
jgi:hypothetical protein